MNDMQNLSLEFADNFLDLAIDSLIIASSSVGEGRRFLLSNMDVSNLGLSLPYSRFKYSKKCTRKPLLIFQTVKPDFKRTIRLSSHPCFLTIGNLYVDA